VEDLSVVSCGVEVLVRRSPDAVEAERAVAVLDGVRPCVGEVQDDAEVGDGVVVRRAEAPDGDEILRITRWPSGL
jgi:hypothetical protein